MSYIPLILQGMLFGSVAGHVFGDEPYLFVISLIANAFLVVLYGSSKIREND